MKTEGNRRGQTPQGAKAHVTNTAPANHVPFDPNTFLAKVGEGRSIVDYRKNQVVFSQIVRLEKSAMVRVLRTEPAFSERFIAHLLARNIRIEEDLVDQLFNSAEKRGKRSPHGTPGAGDGTAGRHTGRTGVSKKGCDS